MLDRIVATVFGGRRVVVALFVVATVAMGWFAAHLKIDAGFEKFLPLQHPYMQTFVKHQAEFGGANRILIAVRAKQGDIFTPEFLATLKTATDEVFFIDGIDRTRVQSLFTPNVRFVEIVEDGFAGGPVIPADFGPTAESAAKVRENVLKSGQIGRLVANDFSAAMISAALLDIDPSTGQKLDYRKVARDLEQKIRQRLVSDTVDVHIIGFAKFVGDVSDGAAGVVSFFALAVVLTAVLLFAYSRSWLLTLLPLACSMVAVIWQLGLLTVMGFGLDPMSILVPFLVFAIGVSHAIQVINGVIDECGHGHDSLEAAKRCFRALMIPGSVALATDTAGFLTLMLIDITIIKELAITASLGVAVIILTNLVLLPVLISYGRLDAAYSRKITALRQRSSGLWDRLSVFARPGPATVVILVAAGLAVVGYLGGQNLKVGDLQAGAPELREDSRYNRDIATITSSFSIGVDLLTVIVETRPDACIDYSVIEAVDRFEVSMRQVEGVRSVLGLATAMRAVNAGWNEGSLKWRVLPRDSQVLVRAVTPIETSTGLLNPNCSVIPVTIFTEDHKAETIERIVTAVKAFAAQNDRPDLAFRLATGNVGVMAASNEAVEAAQLPMLLWVYGAVIVLCLLTFRSVTATLCVITPLVLVSMLCNALMASLDIGLKVATLPVAALGVGIGVDYGIYIFSRLQVHQRAGMAFLPAYRQTLAETGSAVLVTGITLAVGVSTWIFSALKFQADMGILLTFMFLLNMLGAVLLLPALAAWFDRLSFRRAPTPAPR